MANTTGNPGGSEPGPTGEPVSDYGYSGGYGYGPGYGDPDGGGDYSYGQPGYADPPGPGPGAGQAAGNIAAGQPAGDAFQPAPPVVAATPALKGYPGGPGLGAATGAAARPADGEVHGLSSPSLWQRAQRAWRDSGVEWQRSVTDGEPAEAEWERVQAAPSGKYRGPAGQAAWPGRRPGKLSGRLSAKSLVKPPGRTVGLSGRSAKSPGSTVGLSRRTARSPGRSAKSPGSAVGLSRRTARSPGRSAKSPGSAVGLSGPTAKSPGRTAKSPGSAWHVRRGVWLAAVAVLVVLVLVVVGFLVFDGNGGASTGSATLAPYPPARLAGADFGTDPGQRARGIFQSVSAVAAAGGTIVAVGSLTGQWVPRAQFLVSVDGGHSWRLAPVRAPGGAAPPPADLPLLVAGGAGSWLALGHGAAWTSPDGKAWTLAPGTGIAPLQAADRVRALARTGSGFLAVGENVPRGDQAKSSPVVWTSANGLSWRRRPATSLHLAVASGGQVTRLSRVAARGSDVIVEGEIVSAHGRGKHRTTSRSDGLWRSANGGASWAPAHLPAGRGATSRIAGLAAAGSRFVAIRPGRTKKAGNDAVAYVSPGGSYWNRAAVITAAKKDDLKVTTVGGSDQGAVVSGQVAGGARVAWVSSNGKSWRSVANLGSSAQSLAGVTVTTGRTVVAAGATVRAADGQQPYLILAGAQARPVSFGAIAGATGPALGVSGIAVAGRTQVAVGTANGYPAIWSAASSGRWRRTDSAALTRPGLGALASVVHGRSGWLAVGAVAAGTSSDPVVVTSADGASWQASGGDTAFAGPGVTVHQAAAGRSGYVIVGTQVIPARTVTKTTVVRRHKHVTRHVIPSRTVAAAWWSAGLAGWTRGIDAAAGDLDGPGVRKMDAVASAGTGFVGAGSVNHVPAVWTSADGKKWDLTYLRSPAGASAAVLQKLAARGRVVVATGTQTTATGTAPFAEYSADGGVSWQQRPLSAPGGIASVTALTVAGRGFEAVGTAGRPGNQRVVVWSSRDGISWTTREPAGAGLSGRGSQAITALTASGPLLTGVGYVATPTVQQPTLWKAAAAAG